MNFMMYSDEEQEYGYDAMHEDEWLAPGLFEQFDYVHNLLAYGTAICWFMAYATLLRKVRRERSALGLSLQSLFALVFVEVNNALLIAILSYIYYRKSLNLDFWLVDFSTAVISLSTFIYVYRNLYSSYEKNRDTFGKKFCSICPSCFSTCYSRINSSIHYLFTSSVFCFMKPCLLCCGYICRCFNVPCFGMVYQKISKSFYFLFLYFIAGLLAIPMCILRRTDSFLPLFLSFWECFADSLLAISLVPQLFMFYNKRPRKVNSLLGTFVLYLLAARIFSLFYWLTYPLFHNATGHGRGVHLSSDVINILILVDFLYYYIRSKLKGLKDIALPI